MRRVFLAFCLLWSLSAFAQKSAAGVYKKHRFACDSGFTQLEMNICSAEKADFADSIMNSLYSKIIRFLNQQIKEKTDIIAKPTIDSSDRTIIEMERKRLLAVKEALVQSQKKWKEYRGAECDLERAGCEGGSACNLIVNSRFIDMTLARMTALEQLNLLQ